MHDRSVTKVDSRFAPVGAMGQRYLASGVHLSMRIWTDELPASTSPATHSRRGYETVGYVLKGHATLEIEGQTVDLQPGDSYVIPQGSLHKYTVLEPFSAIEATAPPAFVHGRDERDGARLSENSRNDRDDD
jgi:mannose-6-phosphate isomerase-like protein (cupin superfamily)